MSSILKCLINASEKAALIAKACSGLDEDGLLVAEKCEGEANTRFDKDFKTIADVLAQEAAKVTILSKFPELSHNVRGEECAEIGGKRIQLQETEDATRELLESIISPKLAKHMAQAAHTNVDHVISQLLPVDIPEIETTGLGVWIDPIDATAEFIAGIQGKAKPGLGLECVTVLIGVYLESTGEPILGVINQPFYNKGKGRIIWGICFQDVKKWGGSQIHNIQHNNVVLMSSAEDSKNVAKIELASYKVEQRVPGCGHKLLKVALGEADAYVLSKGTTFVWDTCAPHAIIKARGGEVLSYKTFKSLSYNMPASTDNQDYCNSEGIIAYVNKSFYEVINNL